MSLEEMELVLLCAGRRGRLRSQDYRGFDETLNTCLYVFGHSQYNPLHLKPPT
jgi:hypothetical protein